MAKTPLLPGSRLPGWRIPGAPAFAGRSLVSPPAGLAEEAKAALFAHDWPGNVRELLHVLERAFVMTTAEVIDEGDLALPEASATTQAIAAPNEDDLDLHRNVEAGADRIFIQCDATGRPAAEYPVSLINR